MELRIDPGLSNLRESRRLARLDLAYSRGGGAGGQDDD